MDKRFQMTLGEVKVGSLHLLSNEPWANTQFCCERTCPAAACATQENGLHQTYYGLGWRSF